MGRVVDGVGVLPRHLAEQRRVEAVAGENRLRQPCRAELRGGDAGFVRHCRNEDHIGLRVERLHAGDLRREVGGAGAVDIFQHDGAAVGLPAFSEEARQCRGEGILLIDEDVGGGAAEHVHGIVGDRMGLCIIAKGGHEEEVADFLRQGGQGGARSDEGDARRLRHRAGRQGKGGVIQTADRRHLVHFDQLCGSVGGGGLVGLAIDGDHLDPAASDAAGCVDLLCGQLETIQPRLVDRRHAAGHTVERADLDRLARRRFGSRSRRCGRYGAPSQQQTHRRQQTERFPTAFHRGCSLIMDEPALDRLVVYAGAGAGLRLMPKASSAPAIASAPAIRKARA